MTTSDKTKEQIAILNFKVERFESGIQIAVT